MQGVGLRVFILLVFFEPNVYLIYSLVCVIYFTTGKEKVSSINLRRLNSDGTRLERLSFAIELDRCQNLGFLQLYDNHLFPFSPVDLCSSSQ